VCVSVVVRLQWRTPLLRLRSGLVYLSVEPSPPLSPPRPLFDPLLPLADRIGSSGQVKIVPSFKLFFNQEKAHGRAIYWNCKNTQNLDFPEKFREENVKTHSVV
jgi:hypothetical protein